MAESSRWSGPASLKYEHLSGLPTSCSPRCQLRFKEQQTSRLYDADSAVYGHAERVGFSVHAACLVDA